MSTPKKEWTIMVYMAGDNNLSEEMITALRALKSLANNPKVNLIALYDGVYPQVPVKIYEFTKELKPSHSPEHEPLSSFEMELGTYPSRPDPSDTRREYFPVKDFVRAVIGKYQANKYGLIISGHSDGVLGKVLLRDDNPVNTLDIKTLAQDLGDALNQDEESIKLELLGFDGCLMGMVEAAYEIRSVTKILVASEANIPETGWNYDAIAACLETSPTASQLAAAIVDSYAVFNKDYEIGGRRANISALDLTHVEALQESLQALAEQLTAALTLDPNETDIRKKAVQRFFLNCLLTSHYYSQTFMHNQAVDLLDFLILILVQSMKRLLEIIEIYDQRMENPFTQEIIGHMLGFLDGALQIIDILIGEENPLVIKSQVVGKEYQFSEGVSIFFPWTRMARLMLQPGYGQLDFNKQKNWIKFLKKCTDLTVRAEGFDPVIDILSDPSQVPVFKTKSKVLSSDDVRGTSIEPEAVLKFLRKFYDLLTEKEWAGKEWAGREWAGKGDNAFYDYFSQHRNYDFEFPQ